MQYRQGDLLFIEISEIPSNSRKLKTKTIARGEATGHSHRIVGIDCSLYVQGKQKFIHAGSETEVVHEEHGTISLKSGYFYQVIIQREYTPEENRRVQD